MNHRLKSSFPQETVVDRRFTRSAQSRFVHRAGRALEGTANEVRLPDEGSREVRMKRAENLHAQNEAREKDAKKAKERVVKNVSAHREKCTNNTSRREHHHRKSWIFRGG